MSLSMCDRAMSHLKPLNVCLLPFAFSLADNNLTNNGKDMSGVKALAAALKDSQITNLK